MAAPGGVLLVEWPLPWPRDVGDIEELTPVLAAAGRLGARVLLVAGDAQPDSSHTLCWYRAPVADPLVATPLANHPDPRPSAATVKGTPPLTATSLIPTEVRCRRASVVESALALLSGSPGGVTAPRLDVVVCTHGRRDTCCGGAGTSLFKALRASPLPADVRVWRSSHQGGHRFAPTALVLPAGTSWAHLDAATLLAVLHRTAPPAAVVSHYRGCITLADPHLQALDAKALAASGWPWSDTTRVGRHLTPTRLDLAATDPHLPRYEAIVTPGTPYHLPPCGSPTPTQSPQTPFTTPDVIAFRSTSKMEHG